MDFAADEDNCGGVRGSGRRLVTVMCPAVYSNSKIPLRVGPFHWHGSYCPRSTSTRCEGNIVQVLRGLEAHV